MQFTVTALNVKSIQTYTVMVLLFRHSAAAIESERDARKITANVPLNDCVCF